MTQIGYFFNFGLWGNFGGQRVGVRRMGVGEALCYWVIIF
jgi:hypothetical protein